MKDFISGGIFPTICPTYSALRVQNKLWNCYEIAVNFSVRSSSNYIHGFLRLLVMLKSITNPLFIFKWIFNNFHWPLRLKLTRKQKQISLKQHMYIRWRETWDVRRKCQYPNVPVIFSHRVFRKWKIKFWEER